MNNEQQQNEGTIKTGRITLHVEEQEAATLPGCPISSELPTTTSPTKAQNKRVFPTNTMTMPESAKTFLTFQMISSAHSNNGENDNMRKIKIFKIIG